MKDLRQTRQYAKFMESIGWVVSTIRRSASGRVSYAYIKIFPLVGSFIKIQRPEKINFSCIRDLVHKYRAFQIVIEPINKNQVSSTKNHGFRQSRTPFVPAKTIHIDLIKSEKQLLSEMHHKTRYNIKKASQNPNIKIQISNKIEQFSEFWQECAKKQRGMFLNQKKEIVELFNAFGKNAYIIECLFNGNLVSGILIIQTKDIAYYMYAASSNEGKKYFAPTLCVWESIKLAKKLGCKIYDFEGIYDKRFPLKSWKGFTRFKKSFGGKEIVYPGAFSKYRLPI